MFFVLKFILVGMVEVGFIIFVCFVGLNCLVSLCNEWLDIFFNKFEVLILEGIVILLLEFFFLWVFKCCGNVDF